MKKKLLILGVLCFLYSCSPENKGHNQEILADTTNLAGQADSVNRQAEQDGTLVQETEKDDRRELPQILKLLLDSLHTGWSLPDIEAGAFKRVYDSPQGPFFVSGYYSNDKFKDYAVQIRKGKLVEILAYLNSGSETKEFRISRHRLLPEKKIMQSPFFLMPVNQGDTLRTNAGSKMQIAPTDGFKVISGTKEEVYFYRNGNFEPAGLQQ